MTVSDMRAEYRKKLDAAQATASDPEWTKLRSQLIDFLLRHIPSKNKKATALYKWYEKFLYKEMVGTEFEKDVSELWHYLRQDNISEVDVSNGIGLLKLIKQKYERQGVTL